MPPHPDPTLGADFRPVEAVSSPLRTLTPPAPLPCPVRRRQRPQHPGGPTLPPEPEPCPEAEPDPEAVAEAEARDDDAHTARLRDVLKLTAQHLPQAEIARRYGVTIRTVRRWAEEARTRRLGTFRRATADELMADTEHLHASLKGKLLRRMEAAEAAGNDRIWLEYVKRLQAVERDRYAIREKVGFFDAYRPPEPEDGMSALKERHARHGRMVRRAMALLRTRMQAPGDDPEADADEAAEMEEARYADAGMAQSL